MKEATLGIIFSDDKTEVLVVKRQDVPVWVLPGGGIEEAEEPGEACLRELREETGQMSAIKRLVGCYHPINSLTEKTFVFECTKDSNTALNPGDENRDIGFYPINSLPKPFFFLHKEWIDDALKNELQPIERKMTNTSWLNFFLYLASHPILMARYLLSRIGLPINSKSH